MEDPLKRTLRTSRRHVENSWMRANRSMQMFATQTGFRLHTNTSQNINLQPCWPPRQSKTPPKTFEEHFKHQELTLDGLVGLREAQRIFGLGGGASFGFVPAFT